MLGRMVKGIGSSLAEGIADVAGISNFTSAVSDDKTKRPAVKSFDSSTKLLQSILTEVQTIHKVMASQVIPPSEEEEIQRDKDKKDDEVLDALGNIVPKEDKAEKKKEPWWKRLWAWILPFISWVTKPISWIKSLLKLPWVLALKTFAVVLGRFLLVNPIGVALLTVGIIAVNWRDIKKAIKGYVSNIKGWIATALNFLGLGHMINEEDDFMEESDIATDDESLWDGGLGSSYAGAFQTGGVIPKGKVGLAGEAGAESVGGQLLGGPTLVSGGEKGTRVKRENLLNRKLAMKESATDDGLYMGRYQPRAVLEDSDVKTLAKKGFMPGSDMYVDIQERRAGSAIQKATEDDYGNIDMGDDIQFEGATHRQERDLFQQFMRDGFGAKPSTVAKYGLALPAIYPRLKKAFQAEQEEGNIPGPSKQAIGLEKYAEEYRKIGEAGKLDTWMGYDGAQREYDDSIDDGWIFNRFAEWQKPNVEYVDMARGRGYVAGTDDDTGRSLYMDEDNERSYADEVRGTRSSYGKYTAQPVMQSIPSMNESSLQQAGQPSTVSVVNQSQTTNISTASSQSKQNNVGQIQQSIPITNSHGAAPASV